MGPSPQWQRLVSRTLSAAASYVVYMSCMDAWHTLIDNDVNKGDGEHGGSISYVSYWTGMYKHYTYLVDLKVSYRVKVL